MLLYFQRIGDEFGLNKIKSILKDTNKATVAEYEVLEDYYYKVRADHLDVNEITSRIIDKAKTHENFNRAEISTRIDQPILGAFELELASLSDSEKQEFQYPNEEVVSFAKRFLSLSPKVLARFVRASEDGRGGIILVFSQRLQINISDKLTFFVCPNFGNVKSIHASDCAQQLIELYFD
jgi:hypothetical protein